MTRLGILALLLSVALCATASSEEIKARDDAQFQTGDGNGVQIRTGES